MTFPPVIAFIALGANLGDRRATIESAVRAVSELPGVTPIATSTLLENPAVGGPADQPPFLNGVLEVQTVLAPRVLLNHLLGIERSLGRTRSEKWAPRTIDLDLILYGQQIINEPGLTLPHPRLAERLFVLIPLAELSPKTVHPQLKQSIAELLANRRLSNP